MGFCETDTACSTIRNEADCIAAAKFLNLGSAINEKWDSYDRLKGCWIYEGNSNIGFNSNMFSTTDWNDMDSLCICNSGSIAVCPLLAVNGRCGPKFEDRVCSTLYKSYGLYCNEDNGWCGETPAHRDAQASTKYDESSIPEDCITCEIKDDDQCLQDSPEWGAEYTCAGAIESDPTWCETWSKDMRRCCPVSCGTGALTKADCDELNANGACTYPNHAQCSDKV